LEVALKHLRRFAAVAPGIGGGLAPAARVAPVI
jgi:hypothetical protein